VFGGKSKTYRDTYFGEIKEQKQIA
jgi:hypothetical protein